MRTKLCGLVGIKYPIFQGGMAWVSTSPLVVAVSEAGALGILATGNMPKELVEAELIKIHSMTKKPFGVNIMLARPVDELDEIINIVLEYPPAV